MTGHVWLTGSLRFREDNAFANGYSMPYCLAWQPSVTMNETQHCRVGVFECWLKLEAAVQFVSVTEVWDKRANFRIPETQEGEFHHFSCPHRGKTGIERGVCGKSLMAQNTGLLSHTLPTYSN